MEKIKINLGKNVKTKAPVSFVASSDNLEEGYWNDVNLTSDKVIEITFIDENDNTIIIKTDNINIKPMYALLYSQS